MALQLSLLAFVVRAVDSDSPWGRGIYALSSPLIYWRLLYFAQVLPSQGTTIQVGIPGSHIPDSLEALRLESRVRDASNQSKRTK